MKTRFRSAASAVAATAAACSLTLAASPPASAQDADRVLGPIRLVRPLAPETMERLYEEADAAYRGERWTAAMQGFRALVGYEPGHGRAWFRIGNLHQHRRQYLAAAGAYRRASAAADPGGPDAPPAEAMVRNKALLNLALVNLEMAREALAYVEPHSDGQGDVLGDVRMQLDEVRDQAERRARSLGPDGFGRPPADPAQVETADTAASIRRLPGARGAELHAEPDPTRPRFANRIQSAAPAPTRTRTEPFAPAAYVAPSPPASYMPPTAPPAYLAPTPPLPLSPPLPRTAATQSGASYPAREAAPQPRAASSPQAGHGAYPRSEGQVSNAAWSRNGASVPQPAAVTRAGYGSIPAAALPERARDRAYAERSWAERAYADRSSADRYEDDEAELRPQIEYLRGAPRR